MASSRNPGLGIVVAVVAAIVACAPGCVKKPQPFVQPSASFTVDFVNAGTETLMPVAYSVDPSLHGAGLGEYAATQLLAGPATSRDNVVLFPTGTGLDVTVQGDTAVVDITGPLARRYSGGAEDETAMFKSLTFTLTNIPGIARVQVLVHGQKRAALSGGHLELDQPLTRETFAQ